MAVVQKQWMRLAYAVAIVAIRALERKSVRIGGTMKSWLCVLATYVVVVVVVRHVERFGGVRKQGIGTLRVWLDEYE